MYSVLTANDGGRTAMYERLCTMCYVRTRKVYQEGIQQELLGLRTEYLRVMWEQLYALMSRVLLFVLLRVLSFILPFILSFTCISRFTTPINTLVHDLV